MPRAPPAARRALPVILPIADVVTVSTATAASKSLVTGSSSLDGSVCGVAPAVTVDVALSVAVPPRRDDGVAAHRG